MSRPAEPTRAFPAALLALVMVGAAGHNALAQSRPAPDTFTAVTTQMRPAAVTLRADVVHWSDDAARAAVVAALAEESEAQSALARLPTIGYVWVSGSGVGYALKYAHIEPASGGGERVTLVTDRALGTYGFQPWSADAGSNTAARPYSVIELYLDAEGKGMGALSLAAELSVDRERHALALDAETHVLTEARREPQPYWAQES